MHTELMQCLAREIVTDRIREAETARAVKAARAQREDGPGRRWGVRWAPARRRRATASRLGSTGA